MTIFFTIDPDPFPAEGERKRKEARAQKKTCICLPSFERKFLRNRVGTEVVMGPQGSRPFKLRCLLIES